MKKDNKFFAAFFVITIVVLILNFVARKHYNDTRIIDLSRYEMYGYTQNNCYIKSCDNAFDVSLVLHEAASGFYNWDQLPLTEHFKNKFVNRNYIIDIDSRVESLTHYYTQDSMECYINLELYRKENLLIDLFYDRRNSVYVYKYSIMNGKLDDVDLVDKYEINVLTGNKIDSVEKENNV